MRSTEIRLRSTLSVSELAQCFKAAASSQHSLTGRFGAMVRGQDTRLNLFEPTEDVVDAVSEDRADFAVGVFIPTPSYTAGGMVAVHMYVWDRGGHHEVLLVTPHGMVSGAQKSRRSLELFADAIRRLDPALASAAGTSSQWVDGDEPWGGIVRAADDGDGRPAAVGDTITLAFDERLTVELTVLELDTSMKWPEGTPGPSLDRSQRFCGLRCEIANAGLDTLYRPLAWAAVGTRSGRWFQSFDFGVAEVHPDEAYEGWLMFAIPDGDYPRVFRYTDLHKGPTAEWLLDTGEIVEGDPTHTADDDQTVAPISQPRGADASDVAVDPAIAILRERYARGEIGRAQFLETLDDLRRT